MSGLPAGLQRMRRRLTVVIAAWLLVAATPVRPTARQVAATPWFEDVTTAVGLDVRHRNGARGEFLIQEIIGPGVGLIDYDNDGDLDVVAVQGPATIAAHAAGTGRQAAGGGDATSEPLARLFRNDLRVASDGTRTLRFVDVTARAGIGARGNGMGVAVGDYDGDGLADLYLTTQGPNALYRNRGDGTFEDVTSRAGVDDDRWSTSAAFADLDGDGDLDLFVANYVDASVSAARPCFEPAGARDYCPPTRYRPVPDRLFRNRGDGTFEDASEAAGILGAYGNGLGVVIGDYDGDGRPDVFVANDATPNQLWRNKGGGRFVDEGPLSGAAFNALGRPEGSMGIASGDPDADGDEDLAVTNIAGETFVLYANDGRGGFEDRRVDVGLSQATAAMTGFGVAWLDADNDGVSDLLAVNGAVTLVADLRGQPVPYRQRNQLFRGELARTSDRPSGTPRARFQLHEIRGEAAGDAFAPLDVSRGLAVGDLDNDGFADAVIANNGGPVRVLRNTAATGHGWAGLDLRQRGPNPFAIGATVTFDAGPAAGRLFRVRTDGSYLSASDSRILVGLGTHRANVTATVTWPDGSRQQIPVTPGRYMRVERE